MHTAPLRALAHDLVRVGLDAADPAARVASALRQTPLNLPSGGRLLLLALGKAAVRMAEGAVQADLPTPHRALIVTTQGAARAPLGLAHAEVFVGGHPYPDEGSLRGGRSVLEALSVLTPDDRVLLLLSGGGSALMVAPVDGVGLDDLVKAHRVLVDSGLPIHDVNRVRQALSRLKGGGLLRHAAPAPVRTLALSDVFDDDPTVIASGPSVPPKIAGPEASAILKTHGKWGDMPAAVRAALSHATRPTDFPEGAFNLVGSNHHSVAAMAAACPVPCQTADGPLSGDVDTVARHLARQLDRIPRGSAWIGGGETTVRVTGHGQGGRNQELAVRVALHATTEGPWVFAAIGSDGRDGPTDAAGGMVDDGTLARLTASGIDLQARLADHDSHRILAASGDLVVTGPTGTNVADWMLLVRG